MTDDVLRSLLLSQRLLGTREVMLVHHADCGLQHTDEAVLRAELRAEVGDEPMYAFGAFGEVDDAVVRAVKLVRGHVFFPYRGRVRGFVYDVVNGHLREVLVD